MMRFDAPRILTAVAILVAARASPILGQIAAPPTDTPRAQAALDGASVDDATLGGAALPDAKLDEAARALWVAGTLGRVLSDRDYSTILLTAAVDRVFTEYGPDVLGDLGPLLDAVSSARIAPRSGAAAGLVACSAAERPLDGALCSIEHLAPLAPPVVARALTEEGAGLLDLYFRPGSMSSTDATSGAAEPLAGPGDLTSFDPLQTLATRALEDVWRLRFTAEANAPGSDGQPVLDDILTRLVGVAPGEATDRLLRDVSGIRALLSDHPLLSPEQAGRRALDDVLGGYRAFLGEVTGSIGNQLAALPGESSWASRRSFVYLAAQSAALAGADESVTERILTLGSAAVDLRQGASDFMTNLTSAGRDAALGALTGNVLGIASGITAFFGLTPGALGPGAAEEVRALREGVDDLGREVSAGFDGVDEQFAALFETLDGRFGRLETLVVQGDRDVQAQIVALHEDVLALGERIGRAEDALRSYIEAGFDREYSRTLVRCLEHRERFLPPFDEMDFVVFSECAADFRVRAVQDARDGLLTDLSTPVDDLSLAVALADSSPENLARRLPLMGRAAQQRFGVASLRGGNGLANPVEWAVAAQAYLTLLRDWPEHARAVAPGDLEAIRAVGVSIRESLDSVTGPAGPGSTETLLDRVLAYYDARVDELTREADLLARRHRQAGLLRVPPETLLNRIEAGEEGARGPSLPVPRVLAARLPREVRTAAVLALGDATLSYRFVSQDSVVRENERRHWLIFGKRHDRLTFTRTTLVADVRFGNLRTVSTHWLDGPWVLSRTEEMDGDVRSDRSLESVELVPNPGEHFLAEAWPDLANYPTAWRHTPSRPEAIASLEAQIEEELRRYATAALNGVFRQVCSASGTVSLEAADQESARRIRSALDGLAAARALLSALVRVSMSPTVVADLDGAIDGIEGLLDRAVLCATVSAGESPLRMVWLEEEPRRRAGTLADALSAALVRQASLPGGFGLVDSTLDELDAAIRVQRLRAMVARSAP